MNQLYVISQNDLLQFGCPHCGCVDGGMFITWQSVSLWCCDDCAKEIVIVKKSIFEIFEMKIQDTDVLDYIGKHPYKGKSDCMISVETFLKLHPGSQDFNFRVN
jgi:hypothetical protein